MLHYTAMTGGPEPAIRRLRDPETEVSCHYVLGGEGDLARLVPDDRRAWHAGAGRWGGCRDVNTRSLGIELDNDGLSDFPEAQMATLETLLGDLLGRHALPPERVIGHSDCAPGRKIDPGPRFDWRRLARVGLSVWPEARDAVPEAFDGHAIAFGYDPDVAHDVRLAAFRLRFRPHATGPADATDAGLAADLAARFPA